MSSDDRARTLEALRTIANPARIKLYELLVHGGASTVTYLGGKTGLPSGSVSHHMRALHQVGLVEEVASPSGDRREHWWRAVPGGLRWSAAEFASEPGTREVATNAHRVAAELRLARLDRWLRSWHENDPRWIDAALDADMALHLTAEEMGEFATELQQVLRKWYERAGPKSRPQPAPDLRLVFAFLYAFPSDEDSP